MKTIALAAAPACCLLAAGVASAGGSRLPTEIVITGASTPDNDTLIEGKVKSAKKACRVNRTIGGGHYGTYVAKAKRRKLRSGTVCKADKSEQFGFEH